ncbi:T7SS effector LXG polymorphic toxin [Enterococcus plantarum]|uniref:T7SS effector LXG polymorphic toxin n=1 Tax=Enterococcus plantarum TaxID=1077675 RepID=UPI001F5E8832|nr:T7SS effector LXG polymorphic toxin [Enterococcus plantarum]
MPKFRYTEWQNVASEVQTLRLTVLDQLNSFKEAQQAFQSAGKLSGTGWDSTKSYFDAYSEVSTTVGNALNTLDDAITSYLSAFTSEVGPAENDLDTAKMEGLKAELRRLQAENDVIMEALAKAFEDVPFVNQFFNKQSMLGTAKKIEILEKYSAFEAAHGSDFSDVQTVIASIAEGLAFLGSAGNFSGGKDGYKTIDFKNQKWYKALKDFNKAQPKDRIDVVIKELSNGVEYQIYRNGKLDVQKTKELHELFRVHNVELFKEYGPEIFKILTNIDDIEILLAKDSTTMQRSSSGVFLLLAVLPIDRVKDILKSAKLLRNGDYTLDAIKLTAKEWETLKEFEKSADVVKTVDRGNDARKIFDKGQKVLNDFSIEKAYVKPKHLATTNGKGAKFVGNSKADAEEILRKTMSDGNVLSISNNGITSQGKQSYEYIIQANDVIGTKGQNKLKIILSEDGGMLSAYPIN